MEDDQNTLSSEALLSIILHQDNLMWSRIQTIQAIQLAGLASAYAIRSHRLLSLVIVLGTLLSTLLIFGLLRRDALIQSKFMLESFNWTVPRMWYAPLTGKETTWVILLILIIVDVFMITMIMTGVL